ncbi:MAG: helix-turn-helix domain-containing protein [Deltaproteobacteria bacterium]|nr:helix-turn-helix domain-containing protein [Deltaproteobacteria bacterium]
MTPRVVAIGGGKGGVGKSLVAANVGIFLATLGKRVILVDGAFGAANLHIFAGVPRPARTLSEALAAGGPPLVDIAVPTYVPGVRLIAAVNDPPWIAEPGPQFVRQICEQLRQLPADWVVVDLGPGLGSPTLELFLEADIGLLVAVPDPTSIELMHRFIKAAFLKSLDRKGLAHLAHPRKALRELEGGTPSPLEIWLGAVEDQAPEIDELRAAILGFAPHLVINSARSKSDMELGRAVASVTRRRVGVPIRYLGHLEYDEAVWASTRRRRPLLIEHPETRVAKCFERVARGLMAVQPPKIDGEVLPSDSHYEMLEVPPTASFEDIRRANRRIRDIYGGESIAISGLYDPASLEAVHRRLDLAYTTLMDAAKRKDYDMELFPDGVPMPVSVPSQSDALPTRPPAKVDDPATMVARPPMPDVSPHTEFSGPLLRQIREAIGIELREIAEKSKIGMAYLVALEGEVWSKLPAAVYVRGFLAEYARAVGLDGERVKQTYLARFRAARPSPDDEEEAARDRRPVEGLSRPVKP